MPIHFPYLLDPHPKLANLVREIHERNGARHVPDGFRTTPPKYLPDWIREDVYQCAEQLRSQMRYHAGRDALSQGLGFASWQALCAANKAFNHRSRRPRLADHTVIAVPADTHVGNPAPWKEEPAYAYAVLQDMHQTRLEYSVPDTPPRVAEFAKTLQADPFEGTYGGGLRFFWTETLRGFSDDASQLLKAGIWGWYRGQPDGHPYDVDDDIIFEEFGNYDNQSNWA